MHRAILLLRTSLHKSSFVRVRDEVNVLFNLIRILGRHELKQQRHHTSSPVIISNILNTDLIFVEIRDIHIKEF